MNDIRTDVRNIILNIERLLAEFKQQYPQNFAQSSKNRFPFLIAAILLLCSILSFIYSDTNGMAEFGIVFFSIGSPIFVLVAIANMRGNINYDYFPDQIKAQLAQLEPLCGYSDIKDFYDKTLAEVQRLKSTKISWRHRANFIFGTSTAFFVCLSFYLFIDYEPKDVALEETPIANSTMQVSLEKTDAPNLLKAKVDSLRKSYEYAPIDDSLNLDPSQMVYDFSGKITIAQKEDLKKYLDSFYQKYGIRAFAFFFEDDSLFSVKGIRLYNRNLLSISLNGAILFHCNIGVQFNSNTSPALKSRINLRENPFARETSLQSWDNPAHQAKLFFHGMETMLDAKDEYVSDKKFLIGNNQESLLTDNLPSNLSKDYRIYDFSGVLDPEALDSLNNHCWETQTRTGVEINFLVMGYHDTISDGEFRKRCDDYHNRFKHNYAPDNLTFYLGYYDGKIHYERSGKGNELQLNEAGLAAANNSDLVSKRIDNISQLVCKRNKGGIHTSEKLDSIAEMWGPGNLGVLIFLFPIHCIILWYLDKKKIELRKPWTFFIGRFTLAGLVIFNTVMLVLFICEYLAN